MNKDKIEKKTAKHPKKSLAQDKMKNDAAAEEKSDEKSKDISAGFKNAE